MSEYGLPDRSQLVSKWKGIIDHEKFPEIKDSYRRGVVAQLLENQFRNPGEINYSQMLNEVAYTNAGANYASPPNGPTGDATGGTIGGFSTGASATGGVASYDPVMISLVRRSAPMLIAYDICGVQPMNMPAGLIFAYKARYSGQDGAEALYNEADTGFSGDGTSQTAIGANNSRTDAYGSDWTTGGNPTTGVGIETAAAEVLGNTDNGGDDFAEMAFTIEKTGVFAKTRALKAEYSIELAQDLRNIHGMDAESELSNMLTTEILTEINREVVRTIYRTARRGSQVNVTTPGTFDLDTDSSGRWSVEKFKGLVFQIEREANRIGQETRRGRGNFILCSADVASALQMTGMLDYTPALAGNAGLQVDDTGSTFAGVLGGKYKVFIDPYAANQSTSQFFCMGYKGANAYDAGLFYCPYVPLQLVRAVDPHTFQPKIGFKTRYGMVANPFVQLDAADANGTLSSNKNYYYRFSRVLNLL